MKKRSMFLLVIIFIILVIILSVFLVNRSDNKNFISTSYADILKMVENKESFVLCISATDCSHCQSFKPKLKKISKDYNTKIYYIDIDKIDKDDYDKFKTDFSFDGGTPTTLFIIDGEEKTVANRIDGDVSIEKVVNKLKKNGFIK